MDEQQAHRFERRCDVAVIGGSAAGLAAALQLGRQRRSVIVIDAGEPRNAPAAHMHSYLGHEGLPPGELAAIARKEVRSYGGEILTGRATDVVRTDDGRLRVELVGGNAVVARRVLVATGLVDDLPEIDGVAELWGTDVIHCPFCHGYEVRDQRIVQIITHPIGLHSAGLFRQLTKDFTLVLHDGVDAGAAELDAFRSAGVPVVASTVRRLVDDDNGRLAAVELSNGRRLDADAVAIATRFRVRVEPLGSLGVVMAPHPTGLGDVVQTEPNGETSVPGVYAAGNVVDPSQQVLQAAADGSRVGGMICFSLASEDLEAAQRTAANQADWEHRYDGDQVWSGNPNGTLISEIDALPPGRALDVGAGEGGDAVWLAKNGWSVTAVDVAQRAVDQIAEVANDQGLAIQGLQADANAMRPFEADAFDLVTAHYASILRTPDDRAVHNILGAVAPGGTLLVVGHDIEPMRESVDAGNPARMFDPDAYVGVDDIVRIVKDTADWEIVCHEKRARATGSAAGTHHPDDVIVRARLRIGGDGDA